MNENELFEYLLPIINTKLRNMKLMGYDYVKDYDIFNYFYVKDWKNKDVSLSDMTSDILNTPDYLISDYVISKLKDE